MRLFLHTLHQNNIPYRLKLRSQSRFWAAAARAFGRLDTRQPQQFLFPAVAASVPFTSCTKTALDIQPLVVNSTPCRAPTARDSMATATAEDSATAEPSTSGREPVSTLDRDSFKQVLSVLSLRVPNRKCAELMKVFRGFTLDRPRLKCVAHDGASSDTKLLLLEENIALEDLPTELQARVESEGLTPQPHQVTLDYSMLSADTVLKRLLPAGVDAPSSFETIGHIAHLNLRDEQLPYRYLIGAVLLDKNPHLKTIVNKVGSIENEYRVFQMEVIAGEARTETEVTQHGARFRLDFAQVYWNSRLESEHLRLVSSLERGATLVDMMAGIGPFAVPAAQRGLTVYANDLNPRSAHYLAVNVRLNRLGAAVRVFNMDGRAFLRLLCDTPGGPAAELRQQREQEQEQQQQQGQPPEGGTAAQPAGSTDPSSSDRQQQQQEKPQEAPSPAPATQQPQPQPDVSAVSTDSPAAAQPAKRQKTTTAAQPHTKRPSKVPCEPPADGPPPPVPPGWCPPAGGLLFDHVVMNLPASAVEFLDAFQGAFDPAVWADRPLPLVHCYTFKRTAETEADIVAKAERYLGGPMEPGACSVHVVRDVAPNKLMLCLSFRVPRAVAFAGRT